LLEIFLTDNANKVYDASSKEKKMCSIHGVLTDFFKEDSRLIFGTDVVRAGAELGIATVKVANYVDENRTNSTRNAQEGLGHVYSAFSALRLIHDFGWWIQLATNSERRKETLAVDALGKFSLTGTRALETVLWIEELGVKAIQLANHASKIGGVVVSTVAFSTGIAGMVGYTFSILNDLWQLKKVTAQIRILETHKPSLLAEHVIIERMREKIGEAHIKRKQLLVALVCDVAYLILAVAAFTILYTGGTALFLVILQTAAPTLWLYSLYYEGKGSGNLLLDIF
jgi:hypothetical protein